MQQFTEEELRKYTGKDGMPAYIAFKGTVYDVSSSKFWKEGSHFKKHFAGYDLTAQMADAPHSDEVFEHFDPIGLLIYAADKSENSEKKVEKERYRQWYTKYHPHAILVHFPIALHYFSAFADILFLSNPSVEYEAAVFLSFAIATVMGFVALTVGVFSWWINYNFAATKPFVIKLIGALFTLFVGLIPLTQKLLNSDVPFSRGIDGLMYHTIIFLTVISVTVVGYYGGKITWGAKR